LEASLCRCDVQRRCASGKHSGHRESHSGIGRKPFAFPPESLFAFSPESRSPSPRNAFHVHPGILFAFARNPQLTGPSVEEISPFAKSHVGSDVAADTADAGAGDDGDDEL
jgi:hypothetical protein